MRAKWGGNVILAVVAIVAAIAGAAMVSDVSGPSPSFARVAGQVVDARTGDPIAGAKVSADPARGHTDATGHFVLVNASKTAVIAVAKANYETTYAVTAPQVRTVTLRPLAVHGQVLDASTGEPILTAQVLTGAGGKGPAGSFVVYGVGPGDEVKVSATGYVTGGAMVDADREVAVTLEPNAATKQAVDDALFAIAEKAAQEAAARKP